MAGTTDRCVGLIVIVSGLALLVFPVLAQRNGRSRFSPPPGPPHRAGDSPGPPSCRQGAFRHGNRCYDVRDEQVDYDAAEKRCSAVGGGHLAVLRDRGAVNQLSKMFSSDTFYWIGLKRRPDGGFRSADGLPLERIDQWMSGEETSSEEEGKDCVATKLIKSNKRWKRFDCSRRLRYVCQSGVRRQGDDTTASTGNNPSTEVMTAGIVNATTRRTGALVTDRLIAAGQNAESPTGKDDETVTGKASRSGGGAKTKSPPSKAWLLLPGLQIAGMLALMVWGTVFAWRITEGGTRPLSAASGASVSTASVSAASDVTIARKNFEYID